MAVTHNYDGRPVLFLLEPKFSIEKYIDRSFFCWPCTLLHGLLDGNPDISVKLDVVYVRWQHPRNPDLSKVGNKMSGLSGYCPTDVPVLVLPKGMSSKFQTDVYDERVCVTNYQHILRILAAEFGFPETIPD